MMCNSTGQAYRCYFSPLIHARLSNKVKNILRHTRSVIENVLHGSHCRVAVGCSKTHPDAIPDWKTINRNSMHTPITVLHQNYLICQCKVAVRSSRSSSTGNFLCIKCLHSTLSYCLLFRCYNFAKPTCLQKLVLSG